MTTDDDGRPDGGAHHQNAQRPTKTDPSIDGGYDAAALVEQLGRRHDAAVRSEPLEDSGLRDPLLGRSPRRREPCTFGLSPAELAAEERRLLASGYWQRWEMELVFDAVGRAA